MPGVISFKEDFFERVIDVQWEDEKKVYWMAGDVIGTSTNFGGSYGSKLYTSDDGMHWESKRVSNGHGYGDLWGFSAGLWMRRNFEPKEDGLWILGGEGIPFEAAGQRKSGLSISTDGKSFNETIWFDERHFIGIFHAFLNQSGGGTAYAESVSFTHADFFTSTSGMSWSPKQYHADTESGGLVAATASAEESVRQRVGELLERPTGYATKEIVSVRNTLVLPEEPDLPFKPNFSGASAPQMSRALRASAAPRAPTAGQAYKQWDIYQLSNRNSATGTIRKGKNAGKIIRIQGGQGHDVHGPGTAAYSYFDPDCKVFDAKTGKQLGQSNCRIEHCTGMCYGYYVFVVVGEQGGNSAIAYTEDGIQWHTQTGLNDGHTMWALVVGPRPEEH